MIKNFDNLKGGTVARLRSLRLKAKQHKTHWEKIHRAPCGYTPDGSVYISANKQRAYVSASSLDGLRNCGLASDILNKRCTGYFADNHEDEIYRPRVWQLPSSEGLTIYIGGYIEECAKIAVLECNRGNIQLFDDIRDCARAADELAQRMAELQREFLRVDGEVNDLRDVMQMHRVDASRYLAMMRELKQVSELSPSIYSMVRDKFDNSHRKFKSTLRKLEDAKLELDFHDRLFSQQ